MGLAGGKGGFRLSSASQAGRASLGLQHRLPRSQLAAQDSAAKAQPEIQKHA